MLRGGEQGIEIVEVATGWIVTLPMEREMLHAESVDYESMGRGLAKGIKHDDMLDSQHDKNNVIDIEKSFKPSRNKVDNVFIFDSFEKVLSFLSKTYL